jgi:hypothetical protein
LGATFKIAVSLDTKVKLVVRLVPLAVCAEAVKANVSPKLTEVLADGRRFTFAGNSGGPALVLLPHPLIFHIERIANVNRKAFESDLPMHPSLNIALAPHPEPPRTIHRMNWKTCSVEAGNGISKRIAISARLVPLESFVPSSGEWDAKTWVDDVRTHLL